MKLSSLFSISQGTLTADKNELLFSRFGINYARLPARHRKGSVLLRVADAPEADGTGNGPFPFSSDAPTPPVGGWTIAHCDIMEDAWWDARPYLLMEGRGGGAGGGGGGGRSGSGRRGE